MISQPALTQIKVNDWQDKVKVAQQIDSNFCNSGIITQANVVSTSHDGSPYKVWTDFRRGRESINANACGRQYWLKEDTSHYNSGIKFVYLVDGRGVCIVPFLYQENPDGSLQSVRSTPECSSGQVITNNLPTLRPQNSQSGQPEQSNTTAQVPDISGDMLEAHNYWRQQVGVPPLTWSSELANYAQDWANQLARSDHLQHRQQPKYGENLFMISGGASSAMQVVNSWASEAKDYDYSSNSCRSGERCGHYTQVIWKETTELGCGIAGSDRKTIWVCSYNPPGNRIGQHPY